MRKPTFWFPTWYDTNKAVQLQKMARGLKFRILEVEGLYMSYLCSKHKGNDPLRGYRSHDAAHISPQSTFSDLSLLHAKICMIAS